MLVGDYGYTNAGFVNNIKNTTVAKKLTGNMFLDSSQLQLNQWNAGLSAANVLLNAAFNLFGSQNTTIAQNTDTTQNQNTDQFVKTTNTDANTTNTNTDNNTTGTNSTDTKTTNTNTENNTTGTSTSETNSTSNTAAATNTESSNSTNNASGTNNTNSASSTDKTSDDSTTTNTDTPTPGSKYKVKDGDTLREIATKAYGKATLANIRALEKANGLGQNDYSERRFSKGISISIPILSSGSSDKKTTDTTAKATDTDDTTSTTNKSSLSENTQKELKDLGLNADNYKTEADAQKAIAQKNINSSYSTTGKVSPSDIAFQGQKSAKADTTVTTKTETTNSNGINSTTTTKTATKNDGTMKVSVQTNTTTIDMKKMNAQQRQEHINELNNIHDQLNIIANKNGGKLNSLKIDSTANQILSSESKCSQALADAKAGKTLNSDEQQQINNFKNTLKRYELTLNDKYEITAQTSTTSAADNTSTKQTTYNTGFGTEEVETDDGVSVSRPAGETDEDRKARADEMRNFNASLGD